MRVRQSIRRSSRVTSPRSRLAVSAVRHLRGQVNLTGIVEERQDPADDLGGQPGVQQPADLPDLADVRFLVAAVAAGVPGRAATVGGIWIAGLHADRHSTLTLALALTAVMTTMVALGLRAEAFAPVVLWGMAYGAAPTLLQTLLISAAGAANADVATGMQTTVFNLGIAAGSLAGGVALDQAGPGALPWVTCALAPPSPCSGCRYGGALRAEPAFRGVPLVLPRLVLPARARCAALRSGVRNRGK